MNLQDIAFQYNTRVHGYDDKAQLIISVYQKMGHAGVTELERLTGHEPGELETYANLERYRKERNRRRRQRKPKHRVTAGELIQPEIQKKLRPWLEVNRDSKGTLI